MQPIDITIASPLDAKGGETGLTRHKSINSMLLTGEDGLGNQNAPIRPPYSIGRGCGDEVRGHVGSPQECFGG
jgi:hypothetical protein